MEDQHGYLAKFLWRLHEKAGPIARRGVTVNIDVGSGGRVAHGILSRYQADMLPPKTTLNAFSITGGDGWKPRPDVGPHEYSIGHKPLVERVLILADPTYKRLFLPSGGATQALLEEMRHMELRVDPRGHDQIVTRSGKHDDRVFALALAVTDAGYHGVMGSSAALETMRHASFASMGRQSAQGPRPVDGVTASWQLGDDGRFVRVR
ncbi:MAG: hypothetical protein JO352_32555 [Chloroflexi bacterium]|nr:hypothetical protein [Chloroflexota bacterium]MBV9596258.1 hypothetical protein [Chloroflexota bacterium]